MDDPNPPPPVTGVSEQKERSRTGGRPEYKPTDEQRALVRSLVEDKTTKTAIAKAVGISRITLRKHFADELGIVVESVEPSLALEGAHAPAKAIETGRPEFEPTYQQRNDVRLWAADDWAEERMARQLGISRNTLRKHFAAELEHGADIVRTEVLRDLKRASASGKVAASRELLTRLDEIAPPAAPKAPVDETPAAEPLGKKAQAKIDAVSAEQGTAWADLVH